MTLTQFVKKNHPDIYEKWLRYRRKDRLPSIGTIVAPIQCGCGMNNRLKVVDIVKKDAPATGEDCTWGDDYIVLEGLYDGKGYLIKPDEWWEKLEIIKPGVK